MQLVISREANDKLATWVGRWSGVVEIPTRSQNKVGEGRRKISIFYWFDWNNVWLKLPLPPSLWFHDPRPLSTSQFPLRLLRSSLVTSQLRTESCSQIQTIHRQLTTSLWKKRTKQDEKIHENNFQIFMESTFDIFPTTRPEIDHPPCEIAWGPNLKKRSEKLKMILKTSLSKYLTSIHHIPAHYIDYLHPLWNGVRSKPQKRNSKK